jgi:hypothetical protein
MAVEKKLNSCPIYVSNILCCGYIMARLIGISIADNNRTFTIDDNNEYLLKILNSLIVFEEYKTSFSILL